MEDVGLSFGKLIINEFPQPDIHRIHEYPAEPIYSNYSPLNELYTQNTFITNKLTNNSIIKNHKKQRYVKIDIFGKKKHIVSNYSNNNTKYINSNEDNNNNLRATDNKITNNNNKPKLKVDEFKKETLKKRKITKIKKVLLYEKLIESLNNKNKENDMKNDEKELQVEKERNLEQQINSNLNYDAPSYYPLSNTSLCDLPKDIINVVHTSKFREYCDHFITEEINLLINTILSNLSSFQYNAHKTLPPQKFEFKRRILCGFKQISKKLPLKFIKLIIMAPDIKKSEHRGGLNDQIAQVIYMCKKNSIPYVFGLSMKNISKAIKLSANISVVGIVNTSGAEREIKQLLELIENARYEYKLLVNKLKEQLIQT